MSDKNLIKTFSDPVIWCQSYLRDPRNVEKPLQLRSYQKYILENTRKYKNIISRWGRRSGKSISFCADTLWWAQAYPLIRMIEEKSSIMRPFRVVVVCPYEAQVKELWNSYTQLIGDSPLLKDQLLKVRTSDVHLIEFKGQGEYKGSTIEGHTIGISSSNQGTSLRGLCLAGDTRVTMFDGSTKDLKDITIGDKVLSYSNRYGKFLEDEVMLTSGMDKKELFEIKFQSGKIIQSSKEHRFLTSIGWKKLKDIKVNDLIKSSFNFTPYYDNSLNLNENHIKLCGYLIGDGCVSENRLKRSCVLFTNTNKKILDDYCSTLDNLGIYYAKGYKKESKGKITDIYVTGIKYKQPSVYTFLKEYELVNKIHNTKSIPNIIKRSTLDNKSLFLRHLFSTDGWCCHYIRNDSYIQTEIGYCSTSYKLVQDVQDLLYEFGIYSLISKKTYYDNNKNKKISYNLKVRSKSNICKFLTNVGFIFGKEKACEEVFNIVSKGVRSDRINFDYDKIISINSIGVKYSYDITTRRYHNFIANGLVVHNSADLIFIDEMDYIPTNIYEQVIFPIWTTHKDVRMRICSTPTGRREKFFELATNAKTLGWLHSHVPSWHPDNDNWLSIEQAKAEGRPIEESAEFQVKKTTSSAAFEREYGAEFGEEFGGVYKHTFINRSLSKYNRNINIDDPDIFDPGFQQKQEHKYILGVDWNSYINGGQVVLVEFCTTPTLHEFYDDYTKQDIKVDFTGKYRLFYRRGIKSMESTQRLTRQEIINLVRHYKIDYIYVDYGAGDTNIEELSLYGRANPDLKLNEKLVVIDAGATSEHYDAILGRFVKKRNKSLMVNFSVLSLEEGMFVLPSEEDQPNRLVGQMRTYVVKSLTSRGDYTYEGEDHILDAFNLAIFGFQQKYGQLLSNKIVYNVSHMKDPRSEMYPIRNGHINTPVPVSFRNTYRVPIRDPEKPIFNKPNRTFMPDRQRSFNFRGGPFGR